MITPTKDNVYIRPEPVPIHGKGGIILTTNTSPNRKGVVLAVGPDVDTVEPGDLILYTPRNHVDTDNCHLVNIDYVIAVFNKQEA